jgi:hypothetical protein
MINLKINMSMIQEKSFSNQENQQVWINHLREEKNDNLTSFSLSLIID